MSAANCVVMCVCFGVVQAGSPLNKPMSIPTGNSHSFMFCVLEVQRTWTFLRYIYIYMYLFCSACRKQCVPHSVPRESSSFSSSRGCQRCTLGLAPTKTPVLHLVKPIWGAKSTYCSQSCHPYFSTVLIHGSLRDASLKTFPLSRFLQLNCADARHLRHVNRLFKQYKCADPFTLRFPRPFRPGN